MPPTRKQLKPVYRSWASVSGTPWAVVFPKRGLIPNKRRFFQTEDAAFAAISAWKSGDESVGLGKRKIEEMLWCESVLPSGIALRECVQFYLEHSTGIVSSTVGKVCELYLDDLRLQGRSESYQSIQGRMAIIITQQLGADTLFSLLGKTTLLGFIRGGSTHWVRYARRRIVSALVTKAIELDAIKTNPLAGWRMLDAPLRGRPHFLNLKDTEAFLSYARLKRPDCVAAFAFQCFAGIRTEELCRNMVNGKRPLEWADVKWGRLIDVGSEVSKTNHRRIIRFWPEALTNWCALSSNRKGPICPKCYLQDVKSKLVRKMNIERKAGGLPLVPFKQNDFRRTYASHSVQLIGAEKTQTHMGHAENSSILKKHYEEYVEPHEAVAYFASRPSSGG